ncbi:hypothetical protein RB2654_12634 [Maritimibacter alkaliphilus HTCC2654]|uniref:Uncharacterized protein n=1 Tax=Maritimibacter alkaliphilus HTCC2654 TaxID=314271 RepID=A3VCQ0_9RHOB|nr:hypothetical protein RB2654_12634 [Maritimibacter alkaliphilus HTCC2654]
MLWLELGAVGMSTACGAENEIAHKM